MQEKDNRKETKKANGNQPLFQILWLAVLLGYATLGSDSAVTSIAIPDRVTTIGMYAFEHCEGLTNVTLGNGVLSIGLEAFESVP